MNNVEKTFKAPGGFRRPIELRSFLIAHLNRIYCAKAHLYERLPELAEQADLEHLKSAILDTWKNIARQKARVEEVYVLLEEEPSIAGCDELIRFVEDSFTTIYLRRQEPGSRDLAILLYLSVIESIELASFQLLQMAVVDLPNKRIKDLLQENFDESKADRVLFLQITAIHIC